MLQKDVRTGAESHLAMAVGWHRLERLKAQHERVLEGGVPVRLQAALQLGDVGFLRAAGALSSCLSTCAGSWAAL